MRIKRSEIAEKQALCPYCWNEVSFEPTSVCCAEVHGDKFYILKDENLDPVLCSETQVEEDLG